MRDIGIGPKEVRFVPTPPGTLLIDAAWNDLAKRGETQDSIQLSLFGQSSETQRLFLEQIRAASEEYGIPTRREQFTIRELKKSVGIHPTLRLAGTTEGMANNKLFLRLMMERRLQQRRDDPSSLNIDFVPVPQGQDVQQPIWEAAVKKLLEKNGKHSVIVKATNSASGDALDFFSNLRDVQEFIMRHRRGNPDIQFVVEEDCRREKEEEMSAQFLVKSNGEVVYLGATQNLVKKNERGHEVVHQGNIIAGDPNHRINTKLNRHIERLKQIVEYFAKLGYRGYIGLDLLVLKSGAIKVLEGNARITGATYPLLILEQIAKQKGTRDFVVFATNTITPMGSDRPRTFKELKEKLDGLMYEPGNKAGVIPVLVSTLPEKFGAAIVAPDTGQAIQILEMVHSRLGSPAGGL
jgi:hypothetical protein